MRAFFFFSHTHKKCDAGVIVRAQMQNTELRQGGSEALAEAELVTEHVDSRLL